MDTKSIILDIVKHTSGLGLIENIKIVGTETETVINAIDPDRTVILKASLHEPIAEFEGEFGMGNLGLLSNLTRLSTYANDATITVERRIRGGNEVPSSLLFKDKNGNNDEYRFMSKEIVDQAMGNAQMVNVDWNVEITPSKAKVIELSEVASVYMNLEPNFTVKLNGTDLVFEVGSTESGIQGRRIFAQNVSGKLAQNWSWKLNPILNVLKLGMVTVCNMRISDRGVLELTIDSGIGAYTYLFPAMSR